MRRRPARGPGWRARGVPARLREPGPGARAAGLAVAVGLVAVAAPAAVGVGRASARVPPAPAAAAAAGAGAGWVRVAVAGDGRCLFRAVAQGEHRHAQGGKKGPGLDGRGEARRADELRAAAVAELRRRRAEVAPFVDGDFDAYLARMAHPGTWGGEPELMALAHVVRAVLAVHLASPAGPQLLSEYGYPEYAGAQGACPPIHLLYSGGVHYDLLVAPGAAPPEL